MLVQKLANTHLNVDTTVPQDEIRPGIISHYTGMEGSEMIKNMINGQCDCQHNTAGNNCERCKDFHHALPWHPGDPNTGEAFACKGSCFLFWLVNEI